MLFEERAALILGEVNRNRVAAVQDLAALANTSESTIRRDIAQLAKAGRLNKVHGGATALEALYVAEESDVLTKSGLNTREKMAIANFAATLITDDDFVYIDAGTTTLALVEAIAHSRATFITNAIVHARILLGKGLSVCVTGGKLKSGTEALTGPDTMSALERYNFTKAFIGANGVAVRQGFTTTDINEAAVKSKAASKAHTAYVLADSSKFGLVTPVTFAVAELVTVITNAPPATEFLEKFNIKVVVEK
jgi:DeoR family fructose operon transcriptional repressor